MTDLVAHLLLFSLIGIVFLMLPLIAGWFVRPVNPTEEKLAAYECGEPTIGSAYIQFDLRFYVVALLFIIFDVEIAFFFPWATVFGGATTLLDPRTTDAARVQLSEKLLNFAPGTLPPEHVIDSWTAERIAWLGLSDILVFFAILLLAFAYVWKRGDLDWVRAVARARVAGSARPTATTPSVSSGRTLETVA